MEKTGTVRLGILGAANIVRRSVIEPSLKLNNLKILGIASRDPEKASEFAAKYDIPLSFGSYEELLQCEEIDAVYIPLINSLHAEWTIKAVEAGKHVLVEKPLCMNSQDAGRIEKCSYEHPGAVILEGLMSQHHPFNAKIKELIQNGKHGMLQSIKTRACYVLENPNDFRLFPDKGGSVFFDEGLLWCHLTQECLGLEPSDISAASDFDGPYGGDQTFQAKLQYRGGVYSELFCSCVHPYQADHILEFEKADIMIRNFWKPTFGEQKLKLVISYRNPEEIEYFVFDPQSYFYNQLAFFMDVIGGNATNIPPAASFERIRFMEKIYDKAKNQRNS